MRRNCEEEENFTIPSERLSCTEERLQVTLPSRQILFLLTILNLTTFLSYTNLHHWINKNELWAQK